MRGGAEEYSLIWRIVRTANIPLADIEKEWTFERMNSFGAYLQMADDYGSAWRAFFEEKNEKEEEALNYGR